MCKAGRAVKDEFADREIKFSARVELDIFRAQKSCFVENAEEKILNKLANRSLKMKYLKIEINGEGSAFDSELKYQEMARILRKLATKIEGSDEDESQGIIFDINGNRCGAFNFGNDNC